MANICNFFGKIVGDEKEVKEVYNYFNEPYVYIKNKTGKCVEAPEQYHFFKIDEVLITEEGFNEKGEFFVEIFGSCSWSLNSALLEKGYYDIYKVEQDPEYFKGMCLERVHEKFPELKMELFSEEPGLEFSEHILLDENGVLEEVETLRQAFYDSKEEAEEDGETVSDEELEEWIYTELPSWFFYPDDSYRVEYDFNYSI